MSPWLTKVLFLIDFKQKQLFRTLTLGVRALVQNENGVLVTRTMKLNVNPFIAFGFTFFVYPLIGNPSMKKAFANLKAKLESQR